MSYSPSEKRYDGGHFARCGASGLLLPRLSLGLWHNFGDVDDFETARRMIFTAFDCGITHFDLANNYGPPGGSAERNLGRILREDLAGYRDELLISTKAAHHMWPGPYGSGGTRKHLLSSLDQSLSRLRIDYVDIYYSHRFDADTPLEETMGALDSAVRQGKAIYAGISSYDPEQTRRAAGLLRELGTPLLIHQPAYNLLDRKIEEGLTTVLEEEGVGCITFCPLAQGMLTSRYLEGIPEDSRAAKAHGFLQEDRVHQNLAKIRALSAIAERRGQTLAQMALAWVLRLPQVTSALIGASRPAQIEENMAALDRLDFSGEELGEIDAVLVKPG